MSGLLDSLMVLLILGFFVVCLIIACQRVQFFVGLKKKKRGPSGG